jgi:ketosteroid isomerase-like protein
MTVMFRAITTLLLLFSFGINISAATDLEKLVATEMAFAKKAADTNTRQAFLDFMTADAVMFVPTAGSAKDYWEKRAVTPALLAWHPIWADISADGQMGWTTGPWEFRAKGKDDKPTAFGQFATVWLKQADGNFKFAVDLGIGFENSGFAETAMKYPADAGKGKKNVSDKSHFETTEKLFYSRGWAKAYEPFLAEDCIVLIDGKSPFRGKQNVLAEFLAADLKFDIKDTTTVEVLARRVYSNFSYIYGEYTLTKADKSVQKQNYLQIWKFRDGKWQMVLEVFNDIPSK